MVYNIHGRSLTPEFVASCILRSLSRNAVDYLHVAIKTFLVAIPANFSIAQGNAMARACELAGLSVGRMIAEPSVASLLLDAQLIPKSTANSGGFTIAIVDLGGGTFDVAVIELAAVDLDVKEVIAVAGDNQLGGVDYDDAVYRYALAGFGSQIADASYEFSAMDHLQMRVECERAKIALGTQEETIIILRDVETGQHGFQNLQLSLTRKQFRALTTVLDARVELCIRRALEIANSGLAISSVLLAGQGSKIFTVAETIQKVFGAVPVIRSHQETAVAQGLARQAGILQGTYKGTLLLDCIPNVIGLRCLSAEKISALSEVGPDETKLTFVISENPAENRETHPIVNFSTTIPARINCVMVPARPGMKDFTLELVEVSNLDKNSVGLGTISIHIPRRLGYAMFNLEIDASRTISVIVKDDERKELRAYQLNNSLLRSGGLTSYEFSKNAFTMNKRFLEKIKQFEFIPPDGYSHAPVVVL